MSERGELVQWVGDLSNHNPFPEAEDIADGLLELGWRKVSADPDTVERVAEAIRGQTCCACGDIEAARAAINAIGGGPDDA